MGNILAIVNNKGGVGKTTVACNVSHAFARFGKDTLVVDLDSQCNTTSTFSQTKETDNTVYELLDGSESSLSDCVYPTRYVKLSLMPCVPECAALESDLARRSDKGFPILRSRFRDYAIRNFDCTIIDCPPNLGVFSIQGMVCADYIVIPIECGSRYATEGLERTISTIEEVRKHLNPTLKDIRLLFTKVDKRTSISRIIMQQVRQLFGKTMLDTIIPTNTTIQQAEMVRDTIIGFSPKSTGAKQFLMLAEEFLEIFRNGDSRG